MAEKWARMNKLPFPKIDPKVFDREGLKECYVFKPRKGEKNCPTVIHFVLVNINFRTFKAPGKCVCSIWEKVFPESPWGKKCKGYIIIRISYLKLCVKHSND